MKTLGCPRFLCRHGDDLKEEFGSLDVLHLFLMDVDTDVLLVLLKRDQTLWSNLYIL